MHVEHVELDFGGGVWLIRSGSSGCEQAGATAYFLRQHRDLRITAITVAEPIKEGESALLIVTEPREAK